MKTKAETAARLRQLLDQIDAAALECRNIAREETQGPIRGGDWDWAARLDEPLFGGVCMYRTIERLEAEAAEEAKQAA